MSLRRRLRSAFDRSKAYTALAAALGESRVIGSICRSVTTARHRTKVERAYHGSRVGIEVAHVLSRIAEAGRQSQISPSGGLFNTVRRSVGYRWLTGERRDSGADSASGSNQTVANDRPDTADLDVEPVRIQDPDVLVVDLRETLTVEPAIETVERLRSAIPGVIVGSRLVNGTGRIVRLAWRTPVRAGSTWLLAVSLIGTVTAIAIDGEGAFLALSVVSLLALAGTRLRVSCAELAGTRLTGVSAMLRELQTRNEDAGTTQPPEREDVQ